MTYSVCRMDHPSGQVVQLDSFGTEDEAKMCLANIVEEAFSEREDLTRGEVRELVDQAVREQKMERRDSSGERVCYYYIDRE